MTSEGPTVNTDQIEATLDLSPLQHGMLFHDALEADDRPERSYVGVFRFRVHGAVDERRFAESWRAVCLRHQALRASFHVRDDGTARQVVWKDAIGAPLIRDLSELAESEIEDACGAHVAQEQARGFALDTAPLIRVALFRVDHRAYELIVATHHIILDGWSLNIVLSELFGDVVGPSKSYADFLAALSMRDTSASEQFWRSKVGHIRAATPLAIPRRVTSRDSDRAYGRVERILPRPFCRRLRELARAHGLTLNTVVTGAWALVSSLYCGEREVVLGVTTSGRGGDFPGIDEVVGLLINTVPVPIRCDPDAIWREWAATLQSQFSDIRDHETMSLVEINRLSGISRGSQLFETILVFQNYPALEIPARDVRVTSIASYERVTYPLTLTVDADDDRIMLTGEFSAMFPTSTIERLLLHIEQMLSSIADHPDRRLGELDILSSDERKELEGWGHYGLPYDREAFVDSLIAERARTDPHATAAVYGTRRMTYAELVDCSKRLGGQLADHGVGPGVFVAMCVDRSLEMLIGILAVMEAGGAYVPLDPSYPEERLAYILADCHARLILTSESTAALFAAASIPVVAVDCERLWADVTRAQTRQSSAARAPAPARSLDDPAYVIYTSGSTGRPKGVVATQANLTHLVAATRTRFAITTVDRCLQFCSICFDSSVTDVFATLAAGATLVLAPWRTPDSTAQLEALICREKITTVDLPTAYWHYWVDCLRADSAIFSSALRLVMIGGEAYRPTALAEWNRIVGRRIAFANNYGPTEATVNAIGYGPGGRLTEIEEDRVLIGTPYGDARIFLLDPELRVAPAGVRGEIYIGGPGVARGYLHLPEETASRFLESPFEGGGRLYRTGDLARYLDDGTVEYLGRADDQVKIRGYRVEPREVERVLAGHEAVREVAVVAQNQADEVQLVALVVVEGSPSVRELRTYVEARLPEYFVPSAFVFTDRLPLTRAGKVDRRARPVVTVCHKERDYARPRTVVEEIVADAWAQVLGVARIGIHDNFFHLGGHSLLAMRAVARIESILGTTASLRALFLYPTVADFVTHAAGGRDARPLPMSRVSREVPFELSFAQQRLWFFSQLEPGSALYNVPIALEVQGALDLKVLQRSVDLLVSRHEVLRSTFRSAGDRPVQVLNTHVTVPVMVIDLSHLPIGDRGAAADARTRCEALAPFDLETGPIVRCLALKQDQASYRIIINIHHIASDAWSCDVLVRELTRSYSDLIAGGEGVLPELPMQYVDYANWHRQLLSGPLLQSDLAYWRERLRGAPPLLALPTDWPRPAITSYRGGTKRFHVNRERRDALRSLGQREGVTLYMALVAIFAVLASRYSRQDEIVIGSPVTNRSRVELEAIIGFFVNVLPLRISVGGAPSVIELLRRVREAAIEAYDHQELPFERLVEELQPERSRSYSPIFQVMCALHTENDAPLRFGESVVEVQDVDIEACKFDLVLQFTDTAEGLDGLFSYRLDLFHSATIERMIGHFQTLLDAVLLDPTQPPIDLPLLTDAEKTELARWNETRVDWLPWTPLSRLVEAVATQHPDAVAILSGDRAITYLELDRLASTLADRLLAQGVGRDVVVAVHLRRSPTVPVALLAVWKAGAAYLPVDADCPTERLQYMLEDSGAAVVLTDSPSRHAFDSHGRCVIHMDDSWMGLRESPVLPASVVPQSSDLAYVIYTSGSTGKPKGVPIEHRAIENHMRWMMGTFPAEQDEVVLLKTPLGFDASVWEVWLPLLTGTTLAIAPPDHHKDPVQLIESIRAHRVTTLQVVPSMLRALLDVDEFVGCTTLRRVFCGGEVLAADLAWRFLSVRADWELINLYGPTETTIDATWWRCQKDHTRATIPIGRPIANTQIRILDVAGKDVPIGVIGEIAIGGESVARGYFHLPDLTAQRFSTSSNGVRCFLTGDLGRFLPDGAIDFVGRHDDQVKLRGFRIELGEIEAVLRQHPSISDAAVVARGDSGAELLVSYVVRRDHVNEEALRAHLLRFLPEHMVPAAFEFLASLPLNANGKVDRNALPPPRCKTAAEVFEARDALEQAIAAIWMDVLKLDRVGIHDNFFELGGHSLLALRAISQLRRSLGVDLPLATFFGRSTIVGIADEVRGKAPVDGASGVQYGEKRHRP